MSALGLIIGTAFACLGPPGEPPESAEAAEEEASQRTVVEQGKDEDGLDAQRTMQARNPGFGTAIELEHERGARPHDALPEVLNRAPATTVRSLGGLGQFASVSIRGSSAQQVRVARDGIPLDGALFGASDVGSLPLDGISRVELYRGFIPVRFGGATIGGVLNVVGQGRVRDEVESAWLGVGSFAGREAGVAAALPWSEHHSVRVRWGYAASDGNFSFFDDGNTPAIATDDGVSVRRNNDYSRMAGSMRWDWRRGKWSAFAEGLAGFKEQGVAGRGSAQARETRLFTSEGRVLARIDRRSFGGPGGRLSWLASAGTSLRSFADPLGEVGLGVDDQETTGYDLYLSPRMRLPIWREGFVELTSDLRFEDLRVQEAVAPSADFSGDSRRRRTSVGAGAQLEQFLADRMLQLVAGVRIDLLANRFAVPQGEGEFDEQGEDTDTFAATPRMGLRANLADGISLRLSAGRYFRAPTLIELFGDQGYVQGREDLVPESGGNLDLGFAVDRPLGRRPVPWNLFATTAAFGSFTRDLITWVQAGPVVRPINVEGASVIGVEAGGQLSAPHRWVIAQSNYTFMDTVNLSEAGSQNDQPLPGRPRHQFFGRVSVGREFGQARWEPRAFYGVDYVASSYLDPSGRLSLPPRHFHNTGVELHVLRRIDLAFEVRNLLDQRQVSWQPPIAGEGPVPTAVVDYIGYPLPGRSVWASLRVQMCLHCER